MTRSSATRAAYRPISLPPIAGLGLALVTLVLVTALNYQANLARVRFRDLVMLSYRVPTLVQEVQVELLNAQAGQRGFLLLHEERFLDAYVGARTALPGLIQELRSSVQDRDNLARVARIEKLTQDRMAFLDSTIELARKGDFDAAVKLVGTHQGTQMMEQLRRLFDEIDAEERDTLKRRDADMNSATAWSVGLGLGGGALLLVLITGAGVVILREMRARAVEAWIAAGLAEVARAVQDAPTVTVLADRSLTLVAEWVEAQRAALFVTEAGVLHRAGAFAGPTTREDVRIGEGLVGQAALRSEPWLIHDVPAEYVLESGLGQGRPRELVLAPARADGQAYGVLELAFLAPPRPMDIAFLARAAEALGAAVRTAQDRARVQALLEETQAQSEKLAVQQEELRVTNEELEEQSHALRQQQAKLEVQASELEESNVQLTEQTRALEEQTEALTRTEQELTRRGEELERASQHKSQFLANMSHELRTPLNSSLILSKMLADNRQGNLTPEQVKFAETIYSSGNDLLALINDVLDVSKIEAGKVQLSVEAFALDDVLASLERTFAPMAAQRGLGFEVKRAPDAARELVSDQRRLQQVVMNLLSNAFKFTSQGAVTLEVSANGPGRVRLAVRDTGIGIEPGQHEMVFEAFRQADGSTHRKFGGTGLGLSISRELARLLGGDVTLESTPGKGSTFTLEVPVVLDAERSVRIPPPRVPPPRALPPRPPAAPHELPPPFVEDDRDRITPDRRHVLVIEDDAAFARILHTLAHEHGFDCLVAGTASDGMKLAIARPPAAILLDVRLPDQSGLTVLDWLKRTPATAHIPVHVVSVDDHAQDARAMGAVGFGTKPLDRDQLGAAFAQLEAKLAQDMRNVLVVEDDATQREAVAALLRTDGVVVTGAANVAEALEHLRRTTFDCVVTDLGLGEDTGFQLLETIAEDDTYSFPPVIVYTGRSLSPEEEQRLRRFSRSIVIKGARSPERLLAEVTLFLHQVESRLPPERQRLLSQARAREEAFEGRRVLVVEDDVRNIFALTALLEPLGAKVEVARNGREAIAALERMPPGGDGGVDVVLMDIMMPEMDGFTAMREIRKRDAWKKVPILALTAKAMKDDQETCLAAGASDYIAKPLDAEKLLSLLRVWMPR